MSSQSSFSRTRWNRIESSTQRLTRAEHANLWDLAEPLRVDKKTKQRIHFQCKITPLKQIRLHSNETMSKSRLDIVVEQCQPTKLPTCKLYCLSDQLRMSRIKAFASGPFHESISYSEIKCWSPGLVHQEMLGLYVEEFGRNRRSCQVYQCSSTNHVEQIIQLLIRAQQNPDYRLRHQSRAFSVQSEFLRSPMSELTEYQNTSLPRLSFDTNDLPEKIQERSLTDRMATDLSRGTSNGHQCGPDQNGQSNDSAAAILPRSTSLEWTQPLEIYNGYSDHGAGKDHVTQGTELSPVSIDSNALHSVTHDWDRYVTYLEPDPVHGARITDKGPIYMFAMRIEAEPIVSQRE